MPSWSSPSRQKVIVIGRCVFRRLNECTVVGLHRITSRTISTSPRMCDPLGGASGAGGDATPARRTFLFDQKILVSSEFDSGNLANVEKVETVPGGGADPALEFNLWTLRDNDGGERPGKCDSWFYFSVRGVDGDTRLRFNLMKFKQKNLFNQGWVPVFRTSQTPNKTFSRLRDKPKLRKDTDMGSQILTFEFKVTSSSQTTWFAFSYPHSYERCQRRLSELESLYTCTGSSALKDQAGTASLSCLQPAKTPSVQIPADLYFHRELLIHSRDGRRIDLVTISSSNGITDEEEPRLPGLFPDVAISRAKRFRNKRVVFISSRVHPGETPGSHVFNGFLEFILRADDARAAKLREMFVFKLVPILNPDGVGRGHFRVDTRGVNLNRVYSLPNIECHPSVYAARQLMLYHNAMATHVGTCALSTMTKAEILQVFLDFDTSLSAGQLPSDDVCKHVYTPSRHTDHPRLPKCSCEYPEPIQRPDGLVLYVDLHAHANRQGCFIFGNYFADERKQMFCELFPKLCSLNSPYFDFGQCAFSEKGMKSKEGSGRVAMYRATNLVHCYTLECHYASGKCANKVAKTAGDCGRLSPSSITTFSPLYDVKHYEQVGRALGVSLLDLASENPWSRLGQMSPPTTLPKIKNQLAAAVQVKRAELAKRLGKRMLEGESDGSDSDIADGGGEGGSHAFNHPRTSMVLPQRQEEPENPPTAVCRRPVASHRAVSCNHPPTGRSLASTKKPVYRHSLRAVQGNCPEAPPGTGPDVGTHMYVAAQPTLNQRISRPKVLDKAPAKGGLLRRGPPHCSSIAQKPANSSTLTGATIRHPPCPEQRSVLHPTGSLSITGQRSKFPGYSSQRYGRQAGSKANQQAILCKPESGAVTKISRPFDSGSLSQSTSQLFKTSVPIVGSRHFAVQRPSSAPKKRGAAVQKRRP